jgi:hypothetical protein
VMISSRVTSTHTDTCPACCHRFGIDGLVIDPYNELDPARLDGVKEHEHVNQTMAMIRKFARDYKVRGRGEDGWERCSCV